MRITGWSAGLAAIGALAVWGVSGRSKGAVGQAPPPHTAPASIPPTVLGMNLGVPSYYSGEWAFADLLKNTGDFSGEGQAKLPGTLSPGGWPQDVPRGQTVEVVVDTTSVWRVGRYDCRITPGWTVAIRFKGYGEVSQHGDRFTLSIPPATPGFAVRLALTADRDKASLDTLSCLPAAGASGVLTPAFVADMRPFRVIRFMDWMHVNNNVAPSTWAARPLPTDFSLIPRGASVEDMVTVANALGADPWFTLPFHADADYVRHFAIYVRDHLAPGRKAYVELSNEVWNPSFQQSKDALAGGKAKYPGETEQKATDYFYADRVRETMAIWSQVFAGHMDRLVRIAASQHGWAQRGGDILSHADTWRSVDALATAPYFGTGIQDISESGTARVDKVFARLPAQVDETVNQGAQNKATADRYGLRYLTYEGGPDVLGFTPDARRDMETIIHDPRMHDIYLDYLHKWQKKVGGTLVLYDSAGASSYSHKDYTGQPLADAAKMRALVDFAKTLPPAP